MNYSAVQFINALCKRIMLGKVQKKLSLYDLKKENYQSLIPPAFVLSTGRCRTHWLTKALTRHPNMMILHHPDVTFLEEGKLIYENRTLDNHNCQKFIMTLIGTARDHYWLDCGKRGLRFVETNNRITFATPYIKKLIPHSRFIHLTRHPVDFIRSGRNRNWYEGHSHDLGRITMLDKEQWDKLNLNQKIGWLWMETNHFIFKHTSDLPANRIFQIRSEEITPESMNLLYKFLDLDDTYISTKLFGKKSNVQEKKLNLSDEAIKKDLREAFFYDQLTEVAQKANYKI